MKSFRVLEFIGTTLTIVGSFLPWERAGGFPGYATNGVQVELANFKYWVTGIQKFPVYDYGGLLVVLLTSAIIILAIQPPKLIKNPVLWNLIISTVLMASALLFVGRWLFHVYSYGNSIEQPSLMVGLICVVLSSMLLLWKAIMKYRSRSIN